MKRLLFLAILFVLVSCTPTPATAVPIPATRTIYAPTDIVETLPATAIATAMPVATATFNWISTPTPTAVFTSTPYPTVNMPTPPPPTATLSADCLPPADQPTDIPWLPCTQRQTSPDGQWIVSFLGEDMCGSGLGVLNVATGELYQAKPFLYGVHWFQFLPDGRLLLGVGSCEHDDYFLYNLQTEDSQQLGSGPANVRPQWNATHTAFVMNAGGYTWAWFRSWAYDIEGDRLFFSTEDTLGPAYWTPDGLSLIYQHVTVNDVDAGFTLSPGAIHIVDVASGEERPLLTDPQYSYYLCTSGDCIRREEWLVRRIPFTPYVFTNENSVNYDYEVDKGAIMCAQEGSACGSPAEFFWLNWQTGELLPYEQEP